MGVAFGADVFMACKSAADHIVRARSSIGYPRTCRRVVILPVAPDHRLGGVAASMLACHAASVALVALALPRICISAQTEEEVQGLELVKEAKILDLLKGGLNLRLEPSGVLAKDGLFYVIFDNVPEIACISAELSSAASANHVIMQDKGHRHGFEDITYDSHNGRFYILIESLPRGRGRYTPMVQEYDASFGYISKGWLDSPFERPNQGLESLTCVHRQGQAYLLGLCAGNKCEGGAKGRTPGGGRIQVFRRGHHEWDYVGRIKLPKAVMFVDYSGIAAYGDWIAVVSRTSSALWTGKLASSSWDVIDEGTTHAFPRDRHAEIVYGTVAGVSWMARDQVVVVSDKAKPEKDPRRRAKDQSIHIFKIPLDGLQAASPISSTATSNETDEVTSVGLPLAYKLTFPAGISTVESTWVGCYDWCLA